MTKGKRRPTFEETRKLHNISRREIARITGIHVDALWALEETGRGTTQTWQAVITAFNQLAKTDYKPEEFSDMICTDWPIIQVE